MNLATLTEKFSLILPYGWLAKIVSTCGQKNVKYTNQKYSGPQSLITFPFSVCPRLATQYRSRVLCCTWSHSLTLNGIVSIRFLWMRDQTDAATSTWQHTNLTTDIHASPGGIRTRNPSKRAAADQRRRQQAAATSLSLLVWHYHSKGKQNSRNKYL